MSYLKDLLYRLAEYRFGYRDDDDDGDRGRFIFGTRGDDVLKGGSGDDVIKGRGGDDTLKGKGGDDRLYGGKGDDYLVGGSGDDSLKGGSDDDRFKFDPSNADEGNDSIEDFTVGSDQIVLDAVDILRANPGIIDEGSGDPTKVDGSDLDADSEWFLTASDDGDAVVNHPTGTIELQGIQVANLPAGTNFALLEELGALKIEGNDRLIIGDDDANDLKGTKKADYIDGQGGDDFIAGGSGDDVLKGGEGADDFFFDPSNKREGDDLIADFLNGNDQIVLRASDIVEANDDIAEEAGDEDKLEPEDLDADPDWTLSSSDGTLQGNVVVGHPSGTIELDGVSVEAVQGLLGEVSFKALADAGVLKIIDDLKGDDDFDDDGDDDWHMADSDDKDGNGWGFKADYAGIIEDLTSKIGNDLGSNDFDL